MLDLCSEQSILSCVIVVLLFQLPSSSFQSLDVSLVGLTRAFCRQVVLLPSFVVPDKTRMLLITTETKPVSVSLAIIIAASYLTREVLLLQTDRATRCISRNLVNRCTTVGRSCTTNPQQIEVMELEDYSRLTCNKLYASNNDASIVVGVDRVVNFC